MARKFILKYFSPSTIVQLRNEITSFVQMENESLYDTRERFKDLLRKCPYMEFNLGCKFKLSTMS